MNKEQVRLFVFNWIDNQHVAKELFKKIYESPYADTAMKPLNIAHICAIYERNLTIPKKPKTIYRKLLNLLLEEWDLQRDIKRISQYGSFEADTKLEFLSSLAYNLTIHYQKSVFTENDLKDVYENIYRNFGLPKNEKQKVINEIESHNGIFIQSGYDLYEFAHKSTQEFLAADYLVRLPKIPDSNILNRIPNELALAVAISSNPTAYFSRLVFEFFATGEFSHEYLQAFLNRLKIEKPDFYPSIELSVSVLYMYTINEMRGYENKNRLNISPILEINSVSDSLANALDIYENIKVDEMVTGSEIQKAKRYYEQLRLFYHFSPSRCKERKIRLIRLKSNIEEENNDYPNLLYFPSKIDI